jgi:hypothetical protein
MLKDGSIQLPCKPGDYVYQIDIGRKKINRLRVTEINFYMTEKNFQMQVNYSITFVIIQVKKRVSFYFRNVIYFFGRI